MTPSSFVQTFDKLFLLNAKRLRWRRRCVCVFFLRCALTLFSSLANGFSSFFGRILACISLNNSMCSVQYSRDIAWCCVHYIWKHTKRCTRSLVSTTMSEYKPRFYGMKKRTKRKRSKKKIIANFMCVWVSLSFSATPFFLYSFALFAQQTIFAHFCKSRKIHNDKH